MLNHGYSKHIEQYRGLCALLVMLIHGIATEHILFDTYTLPRFVNYFGAGYLSVLVFFCISGYVIAINYDTAHLDVKTYIKKRLIRLYPIYIFSIVMTVLVTGIMNMDTLGNVFFLQNFVPYGHIYIVPSLNFPIWSLNFEVLYYLLFIGLFFIKPKIWQSLLIMLIISLSMIHADQGLRFLPCYVNGYYFWILGLLIGWNIIKGNQKQARPINLLSLLFLHMATNLLDEGQIALHGFGVFTNTSFNGLFFLSFCLMIMTTLTNQDNAFLRFNKFLCYTLPVVAFVYLIAVHRIFENAHWTMCLVFWLLSLAFYFETKVSAFLMEKLTPVGKISYGLYLLHVPVGLLLKRFISLDDIRIEIAVKYTLWLLITFTLSYLLERKLQPAIKRYFTPR